MKNAMITLLTKYNIRLYFSPHFFNKQECEK